MGTQSLPAKTENSSVSHSYHLSYPNSGGQSRVLMINCQITLLTSDGWVTRARALLDCTPSTLFVTERLEQRIQLPSQGQHVWVACNGGFEHTLSSCSVVTLTVANGKWRLVGFLDLDWRYRLQSFWKLRPNCQHHQWQLKETPDTSQVSVWPIQSLVYLETLMYF